MNLTRKKYVKFVVGLLIISLLSSCSSIKEEKANTTKLELFGDKKNVFGNIEVPSDFNWRQWEGTVLDFIVEDNINAKILSKECNKFTEVTGIQVNFKTMEFNTLVEKINMEFIAQTEQYELIYVDPYQTLNRFSDSLEDLYKYQKDERLPHIVGGLDSFQKEHLEICSYFMNDEKLRAIPFDSTTMILFYRKDIFDKYKDQMNEELGYNPVPGARTFTWEKYMEVSQWISNNVPKSEIKHGSLSMTADHNSIYVSFSNIFRAYGGDYFTDANINSLGIEKGSSIHVNTPAFQKALDIYHELAILNNDGKTDWNWTNIKDSFKEGEVAMMINWDENAAAVENESESKVAGKVGYSLLPYGSERSANIYGGSGIGINGNISEEKKMAAWLFIVWATSPQIQMKTFLEEKGGNTPTRSDLHNLIEAKYIVSFPNTSSVIKAQNKSNAYYRPKMKIGYDFETIMTDNLYKMVSGELNQEKVIENIQAQWNKVSADQ
ncbi:carbohydrate ABC transporter substrate-binding protein (CUT1 family) [Mobilisporobacter senegalensis]|uniref:Carbohydrate ABC transporter substrate-binding protein (CUT1 family) n=1 Tax=Mobilisporobacter senegalensis TaxID=1329262 RepID=A0A3N1XRN7_9FIRM|nr:extracellular solute-binding protein [Mobilisporobacter senegalensis]ROR29296.1 carbohydrate ABC transporter substrate-binding protein (CUT1 family) [Mobilisporobacter senegalensis]